MLRKLPFLLLIIIIAILLFSPFMPLAVKQICYAGSLTIKSFILLLLPIVIFSLLFKTMIQFSDRASAIILTILVCVCCSNATSTFLSHYVGEWIYHFDLSIILPRDQAGLTPAWQWQFPALIANDKAMLLGIAVGIIFGRFNASLANKIAMHLNKVISHILTIFSYLIPLFITGFVIKLQFDGVLATIIKDYSQIFLVVALAQFSYICLAYAVLNHFNLQAFLRSIKNMLPAAMAGFSSMSSAASMPLTIAGVESNAQHKDLARSIVPATVNIHLVGDCFAIPIFAYAVMKSFGVAEPTLLSYLVFVFYFVIAKFSVAAIPGGGIVVMLPVLQSYLGFNSDMLSLITALYILFDPVITCANVLGNGALAKLIDKLLGAAESKRLALD